MADNIPYGHEVFDVINSQWKLDITDGILYKLKDNKLVQAGNIVLTIDEKIMIETIINVPVKVLKETVKVYEKYV